jgi:Domain of unknown function (DUF4145)
MDGYQFSAAIVQSIVSLAWPAAFIGAVWLFRGRLMELLPLLKLKHKETEISFRLEQAEREVVKIQPPLVRPETEPTPEERTRFEKVVEHSPRAAILEKRAELEDAVRTAAEPYKSELSARYKGPMPLNVAIRLLRKHNIIDENVSGVLDDLRTMGNQAQHSTNVEFTREEALRFGRLVDNSIQLIQLLS